MDGLIACLLSVHGPVHHVWGDGGGLRHLLPGQGLSPAGHSLYPSDGAAHQQVWFYFTFIYPWLIPGLPNPGQKVKSYRFRILKLGSLVELKSSLGEGGMRNQNVKAAEALAATDFSPLYASNQISLDSWAGFFCSENWHVGFFLQERSFSACRTIADFNL